VNVAKFSETLLPDGWSYSHRVVLDMLKFAEVRVNGTTGRGKKMTKGSKFAEVMKVIPWVRILVGILHNYFTVFTARCTLVQSAVLRSHVVCLSVYDVGGL